MAGRQGFINNSITILYQESPDLPSAAIGLDSNDNHIWKVLASQLDDAYQLGATAQLQIDSRVNGNITLTPNGSGKLILAYNGAGALLSSATGEITSSAGVAGQVLTSNGVGVAPTFQAMGSEVWTAVAGNTVALAASQGYMLDNAALTTSTLPLTCVAGVTIRICGSGAGLFLIAQNAGQSIKLGNTSSTVGVMGSVASTARYDSIELLCIVANTVFAVVSSVGNFIIS